jgi:protein TonB
MALASMVLGSTFVLCALIAMNSYTKRPEAVEGPRATAFSVDSVHTKKKQEQQIVQKKKKKMAKQYESISLLPDLGTNISSIRIGMPDVNSIDLGSVSDSLLGDVSRAVMTEEVVDKKPKPKVRSYIHYPPRARANNVTGYVVFNLLIGVDGLVKKIRLLEANPTGIFEDVALNAVRAWVFEPATYKEERVQVWAKQMIRFDLN